MDPSRTHQMVRFALRTLEEAVGEAERKNRKEDPTPMRRSWGIRLALTYLYSVGIGEKWLHEAFWQALTDTGPATNPDAIKSYIRFTALNTNVDRLYKLAGIPRR